VDFHSTVVSGRTTKSLVKSAPVGRFSVLAKNRLHAQTSFLYTIAVSPAPTFVSTKNPTKPTNLLAEELSLREDVSELHQCA
jgi:hypothetical protein